MYVNIHGGVVEISVWLGSGFVVEGDVEIVDDL